MSRTALAVWSAACALAVAWSVQVGRAQAPAPAGAVSSRAGVVPRAAATGGNRAALDQFCVSCHNERAPTNEVALDVADIEHPETDPSLWERVVRKLRTRTMPPHGRPRPTEAAYDALVDGLEARLDRAAASSPNPGRPLIRRLNRTEYTTAIADLLDLRVDAASLLPPDDAAFGFDNNADLLGVSPALIERYMTAADRVSALAIGAPVGSGSQVYRVRQDRSQDQHVEGLPFGTVGGLAVTHTFPVDGEYRFSLELFRTNLEAIRGLEHSHQIEISIDGARVFLGTVGTGADRGGAGAITDRMDAIDARLQVRAAVTAGPHVVGAAFIRKIGEGTTRLRPFLRSSAGTYDSTGRPHIETLTVAGPFASTGPGDTPSRRRILICRPGAGAIPATQAGEERCAGDILTALARRAYRRPATAADLTRLMEFYRAGRAKGSFESGVQFALRRLLASVSFVYRLEEDPPGRPGTLHRVSDIELASRLSFFLWSSIPDDRLIDAAVRGDLRPPRGLEREVRRMLADPRAEALVRNFAGQWLHVRNLQTITPNHDEFPDFDDTLREAFRREIELFAGSIFRENRSVLDLLTADHTFLNERLARHYGVPDVYGSHFRRVTLTDRSRLGLLGKGSLLLVTSHADRTAPVLRGKWILENLLGTPPPPPPANFVLPATPEGAPPRTIRERLEGHRANPACAGCHRLMDPLGFALENFDAVGAWRERENGLPIDAAGQLADGAAVDGVGALRDALVARSDVFVRTFTEKLLTYALGRGLEHYDMPVVRGIVRRTEPGRYTFADMVVAVASSTPFQMRLTAGGEPRSGSTP